MKIKNLILPGAALGAAALILVPAQDSQAFTTIGGALSTLQRDIRVFDNFADGQANNNTVEIDQFPGYTGAELAVWKAGVEWGSMPHGDGSGDPTQTQLGDGGANFDVSWQGNANGIGGTNDNIVSAQSSCGGTGTLAFTETPIANGWRIRFCDEWVWQDGPGSIPGGNNFDLQEVQTHEYGHALGLGHSSNNSATMRPSTGAGNISGRSIHSDDIAGVQFIYGVASASKPVINAISGLGSLTITGSNFGTSNEVWFTQAATGGSGNPVKVTGVGSAAGGSVIFVNVPVQAGPGDILVKNTPSGTGGASLSNAMPFDPSGTPPTLYCSGKLNTNFCAPFISYTGLASATLTSAFRIQGNDIMPDEFGILIYSTNGSSNLGFHNGTLCVKAPFIRVLPPKNSGSAGTMGSGFCSGELRRNFNTVIQSGGDPLLTTGQQVNAQWFYRDPGVDSFNDGLTDGIEFFINP